MSLKRTHQGQIEHQCRRCARAIFHFPSEIRKGEGLFCSPACYHANQRRSREDRFWEKVQKTDTCWIWTGARKRKPWDYGILGTRLGAAPQSAHRVSWELHHGAIPDGFCVLHRCDNPPCVNPDHLFLGTLKDNTQDMLAKGRHKVRLSVAQIAEIQTTYAAGRISQTQLAHQYGVGQVTISRYIRNSR